MMLQEVIVEDDSVTITQLVQSCNTVKFHKSDVSFPLIQSSKKPASSIASLADIRESDVSQSLENLHITARGTPILGIDERQEEHQDRAGIRNSKNTWTRDTTWLDNSVHEEETDDYSIDEHCDPLSMHDLPSEVQERILDYIFGDMHSVSSATSSLRGKNVSSAMRHPRRKAVSDLALVSHSWRELVQGRIYRHIKIKGTRAGLTESQDYFCNHMHLTQHVRHIEYWVPVWGDKSPISIQTSQGLASANRNGYHQQLVDQSNESLMTANDPLGFSFQPSAMSANLAEIFAHTACFFPLACILTLEGGHCKKSNMIRHFPKLLFPDPSQRLEGLPCIRTFSMRGAWNIMRKYSDWQNLEAALPNLEEWHCSYAKPRAEADATINLILASPPLALRHINLTLDGIYSKEQAILGSSSSIFGGSSHSQPVHICDRIAAILPQLESFSFTGKVCECMWTSTTTLSSKNGPFKGIPPKLESLELVVKSCCRQRISTTDPHTGLTITEEIGGILADGAGIGNLVFIRAFERLIYRTVSSLKYFPNLKYIRIRFIDLDSPCTLLNPYWTLRDNKVYGLWSEEIVERLAETRPEASYIELGDGIRDPTPIYVSKEEQSRLHQASLQHGAMPYGPAHAVSDVLPDEFAEAIGADGITVVVGHHHHEIDNDGDGGINDTTLNQTSQTAHNETRTNGPASLYPRTKPLSIKSSSYKILADMRS